MYPVAVGRYARWCRDADDEALGQRYVQYINRTYRRQRYRAVGRRFRSCLTREESYLPSLPALYRNSTRSALAWSITRRNSAGQAYRANAQGEPDARSKRIRDLALGAAATAAGGLSGVVPL